MSLGKKNTIPSMLFSGFSHLMHLGYLLLLPLMLLAPHQMYANGGRIPEVSIIMPVYNGESFLSRAMDSAMRQTFKNIEIICVDDGSTDGSLNILEGYARIDPRIIILQNGINCGTTYSRVRGALESRGKFIIFLDSDDEILPDIVDRAKLIATTTMADVVHFGSEWVYPSGKTRRQPFWRRPVTHMRTGNQITKTFADGNLPYLWDKLYTREVVITAAEYLLPFVSNNNIIYSDDKLLSCFILANARSFIGIKDIGYRYHKGIGVCVQGWQNPSCALRRISNIRAAHMFMALGMIDLGNGANATQLQTHFRSYLPEHIVTLPLKDGINLFAKYINGIPLNSQLKVARDMRQCSPVWCRDVRRIASVCRRNRKFDKNFAPHGQGINYPADGFGENAQ
ncbi:MAG: glycosyltransferase family 2 protein [Puniceicoccales bacterium]|jgi:glycosyltransferase involved in cell wall biosynthesis|nr:glycosyltransferase family 2 protein [Puniceicoccales bacterium]